MQKSRLTPLTIQPEHIYHPTYATDTNEKYGFKTKQKHICSAEIQSQNGLEIDPALLLMKLSHSSSLHTPQNSSDHSIPFLLLNLPVIIKRKLRSENHRKAQTIEALLSLSKPKFFSKHEHYKNTAIPQAIASQQKNYNLSTSSKKEKDSRTRKKSNSVKPLDKCNSMEIFFPFSQWDNGQHRLAKGYNIGLINVYCHLTSRKLQLHCYDHGQYPWGRHKSRGLMAHICKVLQVNESARNTCLALHIFIGLLRKKIITPTTIIEKHKTFVKNLLSSNFIREDSRTVLAILKRFKLQTKICIRRIVYIGDKFMLLNDYFGDFKGLKLYLVYRCSHFFLGVRRSPTRKKIN